MAKKKSNRLKTIGKFLLFAATFASAIALLFSFLAKIFPPSFSSTIAYCGLLFPYLLILNFVITIIWLVVDFSWALIPATIILLNVNNIDKHFQLRGTEKPEVCANCLKVMSYNAKAFNIYDKNQKSLNKRVVHFLQEEKPDILCIQEYSYDAKGKSGFNSTQAIINALIPHYRRRFCGDLGLIKQQVHVRRYPFQQRHDPDIQHPFGFHALRQHRL